jgi:hypothetical protein
MLAKTMEIEPKIDEAVKTENMFINIIYTTLHKYEMFRNMPY